MRVGLYRVDRRALDFRRKIGKSGDSDSEIRNSESVNDFAAPRFLTSPWAVLDEVAGPCAYGRGGRLGFDLFTNWPISLKVRGTRISGFRWHPARWGMHLRGAASNEAGVGRFEAIFGQKRGPEIGGYSLANSLISSQPAVRRFGFRGFGNKS